jgi:hypothetical protein
VAQEAMEARKDQEMSVVATDAVERVIPAIYFIWKSKPDHPYLKATLFDSFPSLYQKINKSFFDTGFIQDWEYQDSYATIPIESRSICHDMILEMAGLNEKG